ncbi:unnamed protein product [marine sediment metagenome]|uniref:Uncharacterized protein n=1 Tax=marine sediment metagenome TaxID=412755 RepID=X1RER4_9ZZZZ
MSAVGKICPKCGETIKARELIIYKEGKPVHDRCPEKTRFEEEFPPDYWKEWLERNAERVSEAKILYELLNIAGHVTLDEVKRELRKRPRFSWLSP